MMVIDEAFDCWESGNKNPDDYHLYFKDWWQRDLEEHDPARPQSSQRDLVEHRQRDQRARRAARRGDRQSAGGMLRTSSTRRAPSPRRSATHGTTPARRGQDMQPAFTYLDVGGYNYQWAEYEKDHANFPIASWRARSPFPIEAFQNWQRRRERTAT